MKEIALAADVSIMTVSNVVNGNYKKVSQETVERINALLKEMNYIPNVNARILSTQRSQLIAMCIHSDGEKNLLDDPYTSFIVGAVSRHAQDNGYAVLLENETDLIKTTNHLKSWNVAGAIFLGFTGKDLEDMEQSMTIPFVCLDCYPESKDILTIGTHDFNAGKLAGKYLTNLGHRSIAFASGPTVTDKNSHSLNPLLHHRYEGFKEALKEEGIVFDENYVLKSDISYEDGILSGTKLASLPDVTAVFCTADILAVGVMEGLRLSGKRVPQDISVLGFDNLPISNYVYPKLSTINQQHTLKGESAVKQLIKLIESPDEPSSSIQYNVTLVERQTTLPL